ncbi:hypothetical protein KSD_56530 [Ktedonobacter sp. SOSP1-85]|uniref:hypothetical protein n=1 Tax=Ktedonobacter sp. SOSP1-85 TaxID=2778367 RepID=UPI001915169B|nr:hypothetical protein [Ktedonobacter sp. SOSP1-85]GHO77882.1 hypothetical protein KSD_56530 [Ktedonobacter sp. SOSP1-85]
MPLAYGNEKLYLAWEGTDEYLRVLSSKDGSDFENEHKLHERSLKSTRPAIAFGKGLIFVAWIDHDEYVNVISSPDGLNWGDKVRMGETAHRRCVPALTFGEDKLFLAWAGRDHKSHINVTSFNVADDGELAPFDKVTLDEEATGESGPALTAGNGKIYLAWQGRDGHINILSSTNGKSFQDKRTLKEESPHTATPGLAFGNGYLYLSWIGHDDRLNILSSTDGENWGQKVTLNEKSTSTGVSGLTYGNNTLFVDWSGHEHEHHLHVMSFQLTDTNGTIPTEGKKVTLEAEAEK